MSANTTYPSATISYPLRSRRISLSMLVPETSAHGITYATAPCGCVLVQCPSHTTAPRDAVQLALPLDVIPEHARYTATSTSPPTRRPMPPALALATAPA